MGQVRCVRQICAPLRASFANWSCGGTRERIEPAVSSSKISAGLLLFRRRGQGLEYFLVHPGGPYFANKHEGVWTAPKGLVEAGEDLLSAARREFHEETGFSAAPPFLPLGHVKQKSGKTTYLWAFEGDCAPEQLVSNTCEIVWPPHSRKKLTIPEIDRGGWFGEEEARALIRAEQQVLIERLDAVLSFPTVIQRHKPT